jgi:hypothetical protein
MAQLQSASITGSFTVITGSAVELQVTNTGVNMGSALTDSHIISGSVRINPNGLFVSGSGNVGIGTTSPTLALNVIGQVRAGYATNAGLTIGLAPSGVPNNDLSAYILWGDNATFGGNNGDLIYIPRSSTTGEHRFYTADTGLASEKMRITYDGKVGIGTTSPARTLHVVGQTAFDMSTAGVVVQDSSGVSQIVSYKQTGATYHDLHLRGANLGIAISGSNGNVGINTASPIDKLNVSGAATFTGTLSNPSNTSVGSLQIGYDGTNGVIQTWNSSPLLVSTYNYQAFNISGTERMRIGANGNIAIGDSPVLSTSAWFGALALGKSGTDKVVIGYVSSSTNGAVIGGHNSALNAWANINIAGTNIIFRSGETEYMRLTSDGNVGIGTTSPLITASGRGNLTINGSSSSILAFGIAGAYSGYIFSSGTSLELDAQGARIIQFNTNGQERMRITSGGSLQIGTSSGSGAKTFIYDNRSNSSAIDESALYIRQDGSNPIQTWAGGGANERMRITSGGLVGINTNSPTSRLSVRSTTASSTVMDVQGTAGQLFSVTDNLVGDIFSVSDISGIPILNVNSDGTVSVDDTLTVNGQDVFNVDPYAVGSTLLCSRYDFQNAYASFGTVSGNVLYPASIRFGGIAIDQAVSLSGTWRARGYQSTGDGSATLYQRIY